MTLELRPELKPERKTYTLRINPELKKRVDFWAVERGCRPCDVIDDLITNGLLDPAIAKSDEVAA
jgi:hypothetical protein